MPGIVVFGGTFDPVHVGHLAVAEQVLSDLHMEKAVFVPAAVPPHKPGRRISSGRHRLEMLKLATADNAGFEVSDMELRRGGTSYTVDTMADFSSVYPGQELYFLMGMDSLLELASWKNVKRLTELCRLVVVTRPGYQLRREDPRLEGLPPLLWEKTIIFEAPGLDISATDIRRRVAAGLSVRYLLHPLAEEYVHSHRLYR